MKEPLKIASAIKPGDKVCWTYDPNSSLVVLAVSCNQVMAMSLISGLNYHTDVYMLVAAEETAA